MRIQKITSFKSLAGFLLFIFVFCFISFVQAQDQPDLTFVGTTPLISAQPGKIIIDLLSVINIGPVNTVDCKGAIFVDGAFNQTFLIPALRARTAPAGYQKNYQFTLQSLSGSHTVEINLDTTDLNKESDELNNTKSRSITVPKAKFTLRSTGLGKITFPFGPQNTTITCDSGHTLAEPFEANSTVTLTAVPQRGATFTGWTVVSGTPAGAMCSPTANPCSFKIDKDIFVEGKFATQ